MFSVYLFTFQELTFALGILQVGSCPVACAIDTEERRREKRRSEERSGEKRMRVMGVRCDVRVSPVPPHRAWLCL